MAHGVAEDAKASALAGTVAISCPGGMLNRVDVALGMGHQSEHKPGLIADAGDVIRAAVGIVGERAVRGRTIGPYINECHLVPVPERLTYRGIAGDELSLAVGDRHIQFVDPVRPDALTAARREPHPPVHKSSTLVVRERAILAGLPRQRSWKQIGLHEYL